MGRRTENRWVEADGGILPIAQEPGDAGFGGIVGGGVPPRDLVEGSDAGPGEAAEAGATEDGAGDVAGGDDPVGRPGGGTGSGRVGKVDAKLISVAVRVEVEGEPILVRLVARNIRRAVEMARPLDDGGAARLKHPINGEKFYVDGRAHRSGEILAVERPADEPGSEDAGADDPALPSPANRPGTGALRGG